MQVPLLKQGAYLIATVQSAVSDDDFLQLRKSIMQKVQQLRSRGVIVDVTAIDVTSITTPLERDFLTLSKSDFLSWRKSSSDTAGWTVAIR